jgi:ribosomal protein L37AE/L43A
MIDYFKPGECRFQRDEIIWILNNCDLENNLWPIEESNYTDAPSKGINPHMAGESAILVLAEIKVRLKSCGDYGKRLYDAFLGTDWQYSIDYYGLSVEGRAVVNYISGTCRRDRDCESCHQKTCKRWGRAAITFTEWLHHDRKEREELLVKPCSCGANRWQTIKKGVSWRCRKCGKVRVSSEMKEVLSGV